MSYLNKQFSNHKVLSNNLADFSKRSRIKVGGSNCSVTDCKELIPSGFTKRCRFCIIKLNNIIPI